MRLGWALFQGVVDLFVRQFPAPISAPRERLRAIPTLVSVLSFLLASTTLSLAQSTPSNASPQALDLVIADEYVVLRHPVHDDTPPSARGPMAVRAATSTVDLIVVPPGHPLGSTSAQPSPTAAVSLSTASKRIIPYRTSNNRCPDLKRADPSISACSPNFLRARFATPSDWYFPSQLALSDISERGIRATQAWDYSTGSRDVVVAVLDGGIDYYHPDLSDNLWRNPLEIPHNGIDDDGNGVVDDVHGLNSMSGTGDPFSLDQHGTHVAGIIGATGDNGIGVTGVNWQVSLLTVKASDEDGYFSVYAIARGLDYISSIKNQQGTNIVAVNASLGGFLSSEVELAAIKRLREAGILLVAAAGNERRNIDRSPIYPASYPLDNIVSVAATDMSGTIAGFSNYGLINADIAAPGTSILSTFPDGLYGRLDGTSMAAPFVTGALALAASVRPDLSAKELRSMLFSTARPSASLEQLTSTGRLLDVEAFLARASSDSLSVANAGRASLVREANFRAAFVSSRGFLTNRFKAGTPLRFDFTSDSSISADSAATIYLQFRVNRTLCPQPIKVTDIRSGTFSLTGSTSRALRINSIGLVVRNGEGDRTFFQDLKRAKNRRPFVSNSGLVARGCTELQRSLRVR